MSRLVCYGTVDGLLYKYAGGDLGEDDFTQTLLYAAFGANTSGANEKSGYLDEVSSIHKSDLSHFRNRKDDVFKRIRIHYQKPDARDNVVPYFEREITGKIPRELMADLLDELCGMIAADWYIADTQKDNFFKLATTETLNEFLSEVFIYAIQQPNKKEKAASQLFNDWPPRTEYFTGRDKQIKQIHTDFRKRENPDLVQTISAHGGVGKTQIALEYAYRYMAEYDVIWWIDAETQDSITRSMLHFVRYKELTDSKDKSVIAQTFRSWFDNERNWLLIYDNVDDFSIVEPLMPKNIRGNILMTTRLAKVYKGKQVSLKLFKKETALAFLKKRTAPILYDQANAKDLAYSLCYLPLALEQAAAVIVNAPMMSFKKYLALFDSYGVSILRPEEKATGYKLPLSAAIRISLDKIVRKSAKQMVLIAALFPLLKVSLHYFVRKEGIGCLPMPLQHEIADKLESTEIYQELERYSLMRLQTDQNDYGYFHWLIFHPLAREAIYDIAVKDRTSVLAYMKMMQDEKNGFARYSPLVAELWLSDPEIRELVKNIYTNGLNRWLGDEEPSITGDPPNIRKLMDIRSELFGEK